MLPSSTQFITSRNTSRIQTPKCMPTVWRDLETGTPLHILDYGGGKFDNNIELAASRGHTLRVYDPYNRSDENNHAALNQVNYDAILCCNVLNCLQDDALAGVIKHLHHLASNYGCAVYVSVYERDKSGVGIMTRPDQWQRNETLDAYTSHLGQAFPSLHKLDRITLRAMP